MHVCMYVMLSMFEPPIAAPIQAMEMHAHPAINICRRPVKPSQVEIFLYLDALCIRKVNRYLKVYSCAYNALVVVVV